jgi:hypothetical protein
MRLSFASVYWPVGVCGGIAVGLLVGAMGAFSARAITLTLPVAPNRAAFLTQATLRLAEAGYHPETVIEDAYTFRPSFAAGRAAGRITVVVEQGDATILGPAAHVRRFANTMGSAARTPYR